ncbi:MAG: dTMP kinase [Desulfobacteraceae bacterium]|nr:dTMP kinase [Desulfobacteraceae bacterium]
MLLKLQLTILRNLKLVSNNTEKHKGSFIVFEGIDGSGKSTQIKRLREQLKNKNQNVYQTFEPSDGSVGTLVRQMLKGQLEVDQRTIALLFAADRTDHLLNKKNGLLSKVQDGQTVLCDRYYFSSYAYHSQYVDMDWVIQTNSINADILKPDLNIFIDVDPEDCFRRLEKRQTDFELYEKIEVIKKVRELYFKAFDKLGENEHIVIIDGNADENTVEKRILKEVSKKLDIN